MTTQTTWTHPGETGWARPGGLLGTAPAPAGSGKENRVTHAWPGSAPLLTGFPGTGFPGQQSAAQQAGDHYLSERVATATPAQLTSMLYDAAVAACLRASTALAAGDVEALRAPLAKVQGIVLELRASLDHVAGGTVAANLDRLYDYAYRQLLAVTPRRDADALAEVTGILSELRDAWREASRAAG